VPAEERLAQATGDAAEPADEPVEIRPTAPAEPAEPAETDTPAAEVTEPAPTETEAPAEDVTEAAPAEPEAPAEPAAEVAPTEEEAPAEVVTEVAPVEADAPVEDAAEAEPLETEAPAEVTETAPAEAEAPEDDVTVAEPVEAEAPAEDLTEAAPVEAEAPEEDVTVAEPVEAEAPVEDVTEAAPAEAEEVTEAPAEATPGEEVELTDEELEALRERLRADAEEIADEAPEYVVEEAPEEEFVAPVEEAPQLGEAQQRELEQLMQDPEIAAAVTMLGGALATMPDQDDPEQRRDRVSAAMAALGRERVDETETEEAMPTDAEAAEVIEDQITAQEVRRSGEDFASRLTLDFDAQPIELRRDRGRDLERAGLAALAGLAVGMMIERNRVVARSDDRVVVDRGAGDLAIWRDDDVILRQEGTNRRIERYADGSTLTRWERADGSQIVTIRDATGRVLWRERVMPDGTSIQLVDDIREVPPLDVRQLPPPRTRELRITQRTDPDLALAMLREAEADARALDRAFTLYQIRDTYEVRQLVPLLSPEPITFETNRANVRQEEAPKLMQVGRLMERLLQENPREVFLVEGHTDATGPAAYNLGLSDRRAESVALALTEFFEIPPENLVIQGYGERHLRIPTLAAEERNRRVAIRRITPLLGLDL
jgi:outer membrane protein OmpA-like peptidoglycan-associated protein